MEGIDWSGEQNEGKWMAAIHGRNGDTEREAGKDDGEGDTRAAKNGRFNDAEMGGRGYWRSLRAPRSMSATGWQLSLRSMLWPVSGV